MTDVNIHTDIDTPENVEDSVVAFDYSFKVRATAGGGAQAFKQIDVSIVVCRNEVLSPVDPSLLTVSMAIRPDAVADTIDLAQLFVSSDPYCTPQTFEVKTSTGDPATASDPTVAQTANFFIETTAPSTLKLFPQDEGSYTFFVLTKSIAEKYTYKSI